MNRDRVETILSFLVSLVTVFFMMDTVLNGESPNDRLVFLVFAPLIAVTASILAHTVAGRVKPKKYIYLSYSHDDSQIAQAIKAALEKSFSSLSKYSFEILVGDSVPYGVDMISGMKEILSKADIMLIIVSHSYLESQWCRTEFKSFYAPTARDKLVIPIVTDSFDDLHELPIDLSNIKAVSLAGCDTDEKVEEKMRDLAKDLIKRRTD